MNCRAALSALGMRALAWQDYPSVNELCIHRLYPCYWNWNILETESFKGTSRLGEAAMDTQRQTCRKLKMREAN